nr:MAG TPA: hypothetical protein [Caudoviricetes sp.]
MVLESNSYKTKMENNALAEKPKAQKIVSGQAKLKKKGFFDFLVSEDASSVKSYLLSDVLIPNIKRLIQELVTSGINQLLYGNDYKPSKSSTNASRVSYNNFSNQTANQPKRLKGNDIIEIEVDTYTDSQNVIYQLQALVDQYNQATIADLYDLVGIDGDFTDNNYGWKDLTRVSVIPYGRKFIIRMPRFIAL